MSGRNVNPIFATTTPIRYLGSEGGGTGFFLNYADETFLVTNAHVLSEDADVDVTEDGEYDEISLRKAVDGISIQLRDFNDIAETNSFSMNFTSGEYTPYFHPAENVDLAVVPLHMTLSTLSDVDNENHQTGNLAFTPRRFIHQNQRVNDRVSIVGYPGDFIDSSTYFPVRRNALVASPYGQPFGNEPFFVTDAKMHPGTSGSPVIMDVGALVNTRGEIPDDHHTQGPLLIGVHSATFYGQGEKFQAQNWREMNEGENPPTRYELNAAWYPEHIIAPLNIAILFDDKLDEEEILPQEVIREAMQEENSVSEGG